MYFEYHIFTIVTSVNLKEGHWQEGLQYQKLFYLNPIVIRNESKIQNKQLVSIIYYSLLNNTVNQC